MTEDRPSDQVDPAAAEQAQAQIEQGLAHVESGEFDAAIAEFESAAQLADDNGIAELVIAALINQGYAYTVKGDRDSAIGLYVEAAEVARATEDPERLKLALANAGVEFQARGTHPEAVAALTEYLDLAEEDDIESRVRARLSRAQSLMQLGDRESTSEDLDIAAGLAEEAGVPELTYLVRMNQGDFYIKDNDPAAALMMFQKAVEMAGELDDPEALQDAAMGLAQTHLVLGQHQDAEERFAQVERISRSRGDSESLADALYWHGVVLRRMRNVDAALERWDEEATIRRELGQDAALAECLQAQADALKATRDHEAADPLFTEAEQLYRSIGATEALGDVLYSHGASQWTVGKNEDALALSNSAVEAAAEAGDITTQRRALGVRAMALADADEISAALEALDQAEALSEQEDSHKAMVWALARRAYVLAQDESRSSDEVVEQLKGAHEYGLMNEEMETSRSAVRKIARYIVSRGGMRHKETLDAFLAEQRAEIEMLLASGMPPSMMQPPPELPAEDESADQDAADAPASAGEWEGE